MKRLFIMLLIACSAITTISADPLAAPQKKPESVIATLNAIIQKFGQNEGQVYSVNRNPNTNIIESSTKIVPFHCSKDPIRNDNVLNAVDPQLRDDYAIVWEDDGVDVDGTVYMITSLRPDIYSKNLETSKRMFKIEGRVGDEIKDSLYNIYIAESREALYNLEDHEYVACIPVVNKRFEWQTELTKPCVGRLRCIFPDGSLCSAWIDLDFVPGETYHITVHNGYYDEDKDYERRVGRQSGKSLIAESVKVVDEVPAEYRKAEPFEDEFETWRKSLNSQEELQFQIKGERIELDMKKLGERYEFIKAILDGSNSGYQLDVTFQEILKLNQNLESKWQDFFKFFKTKNMPKMGYAKAYKEIIEVYTGQLRELNDYYKKHGAMSKAARKVNSYVLKQNEKYMDAMEKCIAE